MLHVCLLLCSLAAHLEGLEILDPEEVEYVHLQATATAGGSVTLECGAGVPTIFIWAYARTGTDENVALAYNYGQGPKLQPWSHRLGVPRVPLNSSGLVVEKVRGDARGTYTCQALYDVEDGARITFYITTLDVADD